MKMSDNVSNDTRLEIWIYRAEKKFHYVWQVWREARRSLANVTSNRQTDNDMLFVSITLEYTSVLCMWRDGCIFPLVVSFKVWDCLETVSFVSHLVTVIFCENESIICIDIRLGICEDNYNNFLTSSLINQRGRSRG